MESKPIPIKQIAKDLSISSTTVSRALSGKGRVSEDTRNKIIEYLEELGAQPAVYNREYSHRKTKKYSDYGCRRKRLWFASIFFTSNNGSI